MRNVCSLPRRAFVALLLPALLLGFQPATHAAEPSLEQTNLFEVGQEGYLSYRIPCIVTTKSGAVLTFTSARKAVSDWAEIVIMMRRSLDDGQTWEERRIIAAKPGKPVDNPVAIADRDTGAIHFLYQVGYAQVFYMRSDDDGATFSSPVEITSVLRKFDPDYKWNVVAPGPGHGLQTSKGRLIVPVWLSNGGKSHRPSVVSVIYSDDHGATWQRGQIVPPTLKNLNETAAVEMDDGRVGLYLRHEEAGVYAHAFASSADGSGAWTEPVVQPELYSPICFATALHLTKSGNGGKSRLLFVHPDSRAKTELIRNWGARHRENMTLRLSYDDGKTWPIAKVLEPGRAGYADIAFGRNGWIYCLYERGEIGGNLLNTRYLTIARFNLEWLTDGRDSLTK